jgi:hypothetical protein
MASSNLHKGAVKEHIRAFTSKFKSGSSKSTGPIDAQPTPSTVTAVSNEPVHVAHETTDATQLHENEDDDDNSEATIDDKSEWKLTLDEYCEDTLPLLHQFNALGAANGLPFAREDVEPALEYVVGHVIDFEDRARRGCDEFTPAKKTEMLSDMIVPTLDRLRPPYDLQFPIGTSTQQKFTYEALFSLVSLMGRFGGENPLFETMALLLYEELLRPENDIGMFDKRDGIPITKGRELPRPCH